MNQKIFLFLSQYMINQIRSFLQIYNTLAYVRVIKEYNIEIVKQEFIIKYFLPKMTTKKSYRQQNQQIMEILRLILHGDSKNAMKYIKNIDLQYSMQLHHITCLAKYNQNLNQTIQTLKQENAKLTKQLKLAKRQQQQNKHKFRVKYTQQSSTNSKKIRIFDLLDNDDFNQIQNIAKSQKFPKFRQLFQQAWQYRWILNQYDESVLITNKHKSDIFKNLQFQKDRRWVQNIITKSKDTLTEFNKQLTKVLQDISNNNNLIANTQKSLIQYNNRLLIQAIFENKQLLKSEIIRNRQQFKDIYDRVQFSYDRFGQKISNDDYSTKDIVYKLAADYQQIKLSLEQQNINKLDRKKSAATEQKATLNEMKYYFKYIIDIIQSNNLTKFKFTSPISDKDYERQRFQCIKQLILQVAQTKKQGIFVIGKQIGTLLLHINQRILMYLQQLNIMGASLISFDLNNSLQETTKIVSSNILFVLTQLKKFKELYQSLNHQKNQQITDKWRKQFQLQLPKITQMKSDTQSIQFQLRKQISVLKQTHQQAKQLLHKKIQQQLSQIQTLKHKIEELKADIQNQKHKRLQKQHHQGKLQQKIRVLQSSILQQQIRTDIDTDQIDLKQKLVQNTIQIQHLKAQLIEKDHTLSELHHLHKRHQKKLEERCQLRIQEWRKKCQQYQADLKQAYDQITKLTENNQQLMLQKSQIFRESRRSFDQVYKIQYEAELAKNIELQQYIDRLTKDSQNVIKAQVVEQGTSISQSFQNIDDKFNKKTSEVKQQQSPFIKNISMQYSRISGIQSDQLLNFKVIELEETIKQLQVQKQNILKHQEEIIKAKDKQLQLNTKTLQQLHKQFEQLKSKCVKLQAQYENSKLQNVNKLHLFTPCPGSIFQQSDYNQRNFLIQQLTRYLGQIKYTQLVYRIDPYNKNNFHKYIDKHRHLIVIGKTIFGKMFAGYTQQAFDSSGIKRAKGLIFSLWNRKVFQVKDKQRAITYDDFYVIFGNSQLRFKTLEMKIFSNFGISNGYYDNRGQKVDALLGEGLEREVDLSHYEFYTLGVQDF